MITEKEFREFAEVNESFAYLVVFNRGSGYQAGIINATAVSRGGSELENFQKKYGDASTLSRLVKEGQGFPGEYLDVISIQLVSSVVAGGVAIPLGAVKVGHILPGYPFGRGYRQLWWLFSFFATLAAAATALVSRGMRRRSLLLPVDEPGAKPLSQPGGARIDYPRTKDGQGVEWDCLFNGEDLKGLSFRGKWYVSNGELVGQPWRASFIGTALVPEQYEYKLEAKKLAGDDGFVVLFLCGSKALAWVVGGWQNSRSEVAGYESTRTSDSIEKGRWYQLGVRVEATSLEGMIDGKRIWTLPRAAVQAASPDVGFQEGIGVGIWSTLGKFRQIQFRTL